MAIHLAIRPAPDSGAEQIGRFLGTAIGALLWPLIGVAIASIWKSNRTQKRRVLVFTIASVVFLLMPIALLIALRSSQTF